MSRLLGERELLTPGAEDVERIRALLRQHLDDFQRRAVTRNTPPLADPAAVERRLFDDLLGAGPLQPLLDDPAVEEVFVNHPDQVFSIRDGRKTLEPGVAFDSDEEVLQLVKRLIGPLGARLDAASPLVDVRLPDGSRLNAVIPPVATWCAVTIRKFRLKTATLEDLVETAMFPAEAADFLAAAVQAAPNIVISGPTGSGKTTLLGAAAGAVTAPDERLVVIEETPELGLERRLPDCVALQARPANVEGAGVVTIRQLVRNALRQRPTRIVVGEVRGAECLDMLLAMNTGHDGSLTTVHGASPRDALSRLVVLAQMAEERLATETLQGLVAQTIELVIQLRFEPQTGRRRISSIYEVTGLETGGGPPVITGQELWALDERRDRLVWTGLRPRCLARMAARGVRYAPPSGRYPGEPGSPGVRSGGRP